MATVRQGNQRVLLVVDVQVGVIEGAWDAARVVANVARAVEPVIRKRFNSAFEETTLEDELARLGASHVVLAGAATNWCIRATAYGALDRGYDLTLVADAHTTFPIESSDGRVVEAEGIVRELNTVMARVSYPGRTSAVAAADEVDFGAGA